jgi:hypothetical protein
VLAEVRDSAARAPVRHRALADAEAERGLWLQVGRRARELAAKLEPQRRSSSSQASVASRP